MLIRILALATFAVPAAAQVVLYDAGTAGNPPAAPDPATQGWSVGYGAGVTGTPISPDPGTGLNAWEVADTNPDFWGQGIHDIWFSSAMVSAAYARGFELTVVMRMTAGSPSSIYFSFADGFSLTHNLYQVVFSISGNDVLAIDPWASAGTYTCAGAMDGQHHAFSIRFTPGIGMQFVYEGQVLGPLVSGIPSPIFTEAGVQWGSWTTGTGRARFNRVEFRYLDDLGTTHCSPAVANSTGVGAEVSAYGSVFVAHDFLELRATDLPPNQFGYLLASLTAGFVQNPGGSQGNLCLSGNIGRFTSQVQSSGPGGTFTIPVDLGAIPTTPVAAVAPGETWNFQCWYRDANPGSTSNFTNALRITFQ